jgi:hypothetical protein
MNAAGIGVGGRLSGVQRGVSTKATVLLFCSLDPGEDKKAVYVGRDSTWR